MEDLINIGQGIAIILACWAIISGVGAWKREFIGKRKIELAEEVLATFFEVKDNISFIRNPFASNDEGSSRKREQHEFPEEAALLDRGIVALQRFHTVLNPASRRADNQACLSGGVEI